MSAIIRSRVARQVLTGTRGFASVPEVMVRTNRPKTPCHDPTGVPSFSADSRPSRFSRRHAR
jgi:hypothetical protein